jgi:hypothetical protein
MHNHVGPQEPDAESLARRHEQEDLSAKSIVVFLAILMSVTVGIALLMLMLLSYLGVRSINTDEPRSPLASTRTVPPEPRLQALPAVDLKQMKEQDAKILNSYGWVSREANVARIPVERAMEMVAERGLPLWPIAPPVDAQAAPEAAATAAPSAAVPTAPSEATPQPAPAETPAPAPEAVAPEQPAPAPEAAAPAEPVQEEAAPAEPAQPEAVASPEGAESPAAPPAASEPAAAPDVPEPPAAPIEAPAEPAQAPS